MRFGVLGPLAGWTASGEPVTVPGLKVRALLADLLVHHGQPVSADRLIEDLWGDTPPGNPLGTLQAKVSQLRRALDSAEPGARDLVISRSPGYLLQAAPDAVDAEEFAALTARARATDDLRTRAARLSDALTLWRGAPFADFGDVTFTQPAITRLTEDRLVAQEDLAEARLALGEHRQLTGLLADLVAQHPLRERLRAAHLLALYRAGRQTEALASYTELRDHLAEELGLDPDPGLADLHAAILRQDPSLDAPSVPPPTPRSTPARTPGRAPDRTPAPPRTNLPAAVSELIGRDGAVAEVLSLLEHGRLVTLTGSGGVGKTRLGIEAATRLVDSYRDGAWLIELAAYDRPDAQELADAIMPVLGLRQAGSLSDALRTKQLLLVLDGCEHIVEPVAELAGSLLRAAPGLTILATSQEPIGLAGEAVWVVPPLAADDAQRLFRARAMLSEQTDALEVEQVCRKLDGIPLALELAATRVRALGVPGLLSRLDDRFQLLTRGHRDAPTRQRTLRATIDWSWQLLSEPERAVLRRLAVHLDGCTLAAAEAVCGGDDVLDLLSRLVDRSLVALTAGQRYRLLESVTGYCLERLAEAGELDEIRRRHNRYYADLAEQAEARLRDHDQRQWLERLDADGANLRAALDGAVERGAADDALRLVNSLTWYWFLRGRFGEARRWITAALALDGGEPTARATAATWLDGVELLAGDTGRTVAPPDPGVPARAVWFLGFALSDLGDVAVSEQLVGRALAAFETTGDRWGQAAALAIRAKLAMIRYNLAESRRAGERSLALFHELGDCWGQLQATEWLGALAEATGDYENGLALHRDGLSMAEELGLWPQVADRLSWLGRISSALGDDAAARDLLERGRQLAAERSYKPGEIFAELGLGIAARREGKLDLAETYLRTVLDWFHQTGGNPDQALIELGLIAEQRGDAAAAMDFHREALEVARAVGDERLVSLAREGLDRVTQEGTR